jgi:hypothetical protein
VERLIAVATTVPDVDLSFLRQPASFEEALGSTPKTEALDEPPEPPELATATLVTMKLVRAKLGEV